MGIYFQYPRQWTQEEDNIIIEHYSELGATQLMKLLPKRTAQQIVAHAIKLNIRCAPLRWTKKEETILRKYWDIDPQKVVDLLPNRSYTQLQRRAYYLHIRRDSLRWSEKELSILKKYWPQGGKHEVAKYLSTKSLSQIESKASLLHLKSPNHIKQIRCLETNQVYDSMAQAKHITGIDPFPNLRGKSKTAGGYHWVYEGDNSTIEDIESGRKTPPSKKVRCIETGEIFNSIIQANNKYPGASALKNVIDGKRSYAGTLPDGTKLHWEYVEDYPLS